MPYFFLAAYGGWIRRQTRSEIEYTGRHLGLSHFFSAFFFVAYHRYYNGRNGLIDILNDPIFVRNLVSFAILASLLFLLLLKKFDATTAYFGAVIHLAFRNFNSGISLNWFALRLIRDYPSLMNIIGSIILLVFLLLPKYAWTKESANVGIFDES